MQAHKPAPLPSRAIDLLDTEPTAKPVVTFGGYGFSKAAYPRTDAAAMFGVTGQHLINMEKAGELRTIRLGRRVLIPAAEIARLLGVQSTPAKA